MRIFIFCFVWIFCAALSAADAKPYTVEEGKLGGSLYKIAIPQKWNKKLILNAHGYRTEKLPLSAEFPIEKTHNEVLLKEGWMIAETSYRRNGLIIQDAIDDLKLLYDFIAKKYGKPARSYILGGSMGGQIVVKIAEEKKDRFDGVLAVGAALLCDDNDPSMCEDKANLNKHTFQPTIPILFYSNLNELSEVQEYVAKTEKTKANSALWISTRRGHCNINYLEDEKALRALFNWAENGKKPADEKVLIDVRRTDSKARYEAGRLYGKVHTINVYGSVIADLSRADLEKAGIKQDSFFSVGFKDKKFKIFLGYSYGDVKEGEWVSFLTADDYLMVARNWENAQKTLGCKAGDEIFIEKLPEPEKK